MLDTRAVSPSDRAVLPVSSPAQADDYSRLKRRIREAGLLDKQPWYYAVNITANLAVLGTGLLLLVLMPNPWLQALVAAALGIVSGQLGFMLHDAGHHQMFAKRWKNDLIGTLGGNGLLGMSYGWWVDKHNRHHANPNHVDDDPDINNLAIAYNKAQAGERRGYLRVLAAYQAFAFFPLLFLLGFSMHVSSVHHLATQRTRHRAFEIALLAGHFIAYVGLLVLILGPWSALMVILVHKMVAGFYMASVFAPNHKGMPQIEPGMEIDFLRAQVLTARNVRSGRVTDLWYGSLNYQIEHHLFPAMPRNRVRRAHVIIRDYCNEIGVPYYETSMIQSYRELLGFLHEVGRPLRQTA